MGGEGTGLFLPGINDMPEAGRGGSPGCLGSHKGPPVSMRTREAREPVVCRDLPPPCAPGSGAPQVGGGEGAPSGVIHSLLRGHVRAQRGQGQDDADSTPDRPRMGRVSSKPAVLRCARSSSASPRADLDRNQATSRAHVTRGNPPTARYGARSFRGFQRPQGRVGASEIRLVLTTNVGLGVLISWAAH